MKQLRWTAVLVAAAVLLAGCGEVTNTLTPKPGTANTVTVALDAPANFTQVGLWDADALGYLTQTDIKVKFIVSSDPLTAIASGKAQIAISNEPDIILERNKHIALASVAAILQSPAQVSVSCKSPTSTKTTAKTSTKKGATTTTTTTTSTPRAHPPLRAKRCSATTVAHPDSAYSTAPTYNGLNFVVTEDEIVDHAPVLRRFIQAVGRGYAAVKADPETATENLVKLNPSLNYTAQLAGVKASLANFFPTGHAANRPWGWQVVVDWNAFGSWLFDNKTITDADAVPDADTNELLAGQGV